jgi:hypothetical protein
MWCHRGTHSGSAERRSSERRGESLSLSREKAKRLFPWDESGLLRDWAFGTRRNATCWCLAAGGAAEATDSAEYGIELTILCVSARKDEGTRP